MIALKAALTADGLVGKYVNRQPNEPGGEISLGLFYATSDDDVSGGWVFDFATKQSIPTIASRCVTVPVRKVERGVLGVPVRVPVFGTGTIIEEFMSQGQLRVRVRLEGSKRTMLTNFCGVEVLVPPRV